MNYQKLFKTGIFLAIFFLTFSQFSNAQSNAWTDGTTTNGDASTTTDKWVGLQTTNPQFPLHLLENRWGWSGRIQNENVVISMAHKAGIGISVNTNSMVANRNILALSSDLDNDAMRVYNDGRVMLGTAFNTISSNVISSTAEGDPYRLFVNGGGLFKEVKVETGWADYVFEEDYQLTSLEEVETIIEEEGHLHNTPSAEELEATGGVELGAMTVNQQEKIEELFLHLIELNKQVKELQVENAQLKAQQK